MSMLYILNEQGEPELTTDLAAWGAFFEQGDRRRLARDNIGDVVVSTVFLGLDHNFGDGPPLLWETMIFGGKHREYTERYATREDALAGHRHAVYLALEE